MEILNYICLAPLVPSVKVKPSFLFQLSLSPLSFLIATVHGASGIYRNAMSVCGPGFSHRVVVSCWRWRTIRDRRATQRSCADSQLVRLLVTHGGLALASSGFGVTSSRRDWGLHHYWGLAGRVTDGHDDGRVAPKSIRGRACRFWSPWMAWFDPCLLVGNKSMIAESLCFQYFRLWS